MTDLIKFRTQWRTVALRHVSGYGYVIDGVTTNGDLGLALAYIGRLVRSGAVVEVMR